MNFKSIVLVIVLAILMIAPLFGCGEKVAPTADRVQQQRSENMLAEADRQIGMPEIVNWQQRKLHKWIFELCDREDLITYAYTQNKMTGKYVFLYKCLGFGIPFSAQYTNPMKMVDGGLMLGYSLSRHEAIQALPQADPNGLFMPTSSSATWIIVIDPETKKPHPIYAEPEIIISPLKFRNSLVQNPEDYAIYDVKKKE